MRTRLSQVAAAVTITAGAMLAGGSLVSAAEGTFTPTTIEPGDTFSFTFSNAGVVNGIGDDQCDDHGYDDGSSDTYSNRPLWIGYLEGDQTAVDPDELDLYADGIVSGSLGTLPTHVVQGGDDDFGWAGTLDGTGTLPELEPGTYTVAMICGHPDGDGPDTNGDPVLIKITVPDNAPVDDPDSDPAIDLELELILDNSIAGGALGVPVAGGGLLPGADYTVVLRSDPVVIGSGTVDENGAFSATYPIPANTPDGGHSVTVSSLDPDGNPVSAVGYFELEGGVVTGISYASAFTPALPATGGTTLPLLLTASGLVLAGGLMLRRRAA